MALDERYSKKYECKTVEKIDEGDQTETYKVLVTKNQGELREFIEVEVPNNIDSALELQGEEETLEMIQEKMVTEARNKKRSRMVSEEEKEERKRKQMEKTAELIEDLKAQGHDEETIREQLGL